MANQDKVTVAYVPEGLVEPLKLLDFYRKNSPPHFIEQTKAFKGISQAEQIELIFWMACHINSMLCDLLNMDEGSDQAKH